mgnify:CR=1 FL=1
MMPIIFVISLPTTLNLGLNKIDVKIVFLNVILME